MNSIELKDRTKSFAIAIIKLLKSVPKDFISEVLLNSFCGVQHLLLQIIELHAEQNQELISSTK
jgi:hypothetical protein